MGPHIQDVMELSSFLTIVHEVALFFGVCVRQQDDKYQRYNGVKSTIH
jgi:hypothetical protein